MRPPGTPSTAASWHEDGCPGLTGAVQTSPAAGSPGAIPPEARWQGWPEVRADLRSSGVLVAVVALAGLPAGLLWWLLAPRTDFRVTEDGPVPVGRPSMELAVADDAVFVLVVAGLGLLAGAAAWAVRRRRGVATTAALATGAGLAAALAWQLGELLGAGPSRAELAEVGRVVTTPVSLDALPALAVAPFCAVLAYLVGALVARTDDLGRPGRVSVGTAQPTPAGEAPVEVPAAR